MALRIRGIMKRRYPKEKKRKTSAMGDIKKQKIMGIIAAVCIMLLFVVVGTITPVVAENLFSKKDGANIDVKLYERKEMQHKEKIEEFNSLYDDFNKKYDEFLYAAYVVKASESIYFNDKAIQEMGAYVKHYEKEAGDLKNTADFLCKTFKTKTGEKDKTYTFLNETLNKENIKELKKAYVKLSDITTLVNNSIVNVDIYNGYFFLEEERKSVVNVAETLIGEITYQWGGKAGSPGWNASWDNGNGLDCSGFVQWAYWTATGKYIEDISSTYSISLTQEPISYTQLIPGDLGMIYPDGTYYTDAAGNKFYSYEAAVVSNAVKGLGENAEVTTHTNHVGIYAGKDIYGNDIWIHCQGGMVNTVVKDNYEKFSVYYRVNTGDEN